MIRFWILFSFCSISTSYLFGQVNAPELLCVSNDTLKWDIPANNCGPFNSYLIYRSDDRNGPFQVMATITDPNQTAFFDGNAASETWYFMESDLDCPGATVFQSDTINNRNPEPPTIRFASVDNNTVNIAWEASPSAQVADYLVYRQTNAGTTLIDTVFNDLQYADQGAAPMDGSETYYVLGLDRCGNTSPFRDEHRTIFLQATDVDPCLQAVNLSWSGYRGWQEGVSSYEIWGSINGGDFSLFETIPGTDSAYSVSPVNDQSNYCFFVRATQDFIGESAASNFVCETVDVVQPPGQIVVTNVSVTPNDSIAVQWQWDATSELTTYQIERSTNGKDFIAIESVDNPANLSEEMTYIDEDITPNETPIYYRVSATDACDTTSTSNNGRSIFLQASSLSDGTFELKWTAYQNEFANLLEYEIYRLVNGQETLAGIADAFTGSYIDAPSQGGTFVTNACYYVVAVATVNLPNGRRIIVRSRSNEDCAALQAQVFVPNAFVPDGVNNIFKPILQFGIPQNYTMTIYDRWGGQVFQTTNVDTGWDGTKNNEALPQGVYAYFIQVVQEEGVTVEKAGTVLLLR